MYEVKFVEPRLVQMTPCLFCASNNWTAIPIVKSHSAKISASYPPLFLTEINIVTQILRTYIESLVTSQNLQKYAIQLSCLEIS